MADRFFELIRLSGFLYFSNAGAVGTAEGVVVIEYRVVHIVLSVKDNGDDLGLLQTQENFEVIAVVLHQSGALHVRLKELRLLIVVPHESENLGHCDLGDEDSANPMMDQAAGNSNGRAVVEGFESLSDHSSVCKSTSFCFCAGRRSIHRKPSVSVSVVIRRSLNCT